MKNTAAFIVVLTAIAMAGCDTIYGVSRSARVSQLPDPSKVKSLIAKVPGVETVDYSFSEDGRPITLTGIQIPDRIYSFEYAGGANIHGSLQFEVNYASNVVFRQTLLRMHQPPPQAWVDATRPVMKQVERLLEQECELTGLSTSVVEHCHGVK